MRLQPTFIYTSYKLVEADRRLSALECRACQSRILQTIIVAFCARTESSYCMFGEYNVNEEPRTKGSRGLPSRAI